MDPRGCLLCQPVRPTLQKDRTPTLETGDGGSRSPAGCLGLGLGQRRVPTPSVLGSLSRPKPSSGYNYSRANRIRGALKSKKSN